MFDRELAKASQAIIRALTEQGLPTPQRIDWSPTPFHGQWGFGTAAFFQIAAQEARRGKGGCVPERAAEIAQAVLQAIGTPEGFSRASVERGYLNLYLEPGLYAKRVVNTILAQGEDFGRGHPKDERVMVEYSQPNTHKAFHVGHLRNVILGGAMANILEFAGCDTVRANYIGDIGLHVIKWLWCYRKYHPGEQPQGDKTRWMQEIYTEAERRLEENPENEQEVRALFAAWEARDPELVQLWERTRQWSMEGFQEIYDLLGEHFDVIFYESEVEEPGKRLVEDLIARGIAIDERPDGPVLIKIDELLGLEKETYRTLVVLRSDGTSLYSTKDLPLAIRKFEEWKVDRSIYVIDVRQSLYLKQIFKVLELMGFEQARNCVHLSYEIVNLPGNVTMSSREGTVVLFDDLIREAFARAGRIVELKNPSLPDDQKQIVARAVALGALKYAMLAVDNNKVVTFDWDRALDFEGQAAPYIQYAHVRANSILRRAGSIPQDATFEHPLEASEIQLLELLARFPQEVQRAAAEYKPLQIANYVYNLARAFTDFYQHCPVLQAEGAAGAARLRLTAAARQTLASGLRLLGIEAPEVM